MLLTSFFILNKFVLLQLNTRGDDPDPRVSLFQDDGDQETHILPVRALVFECAEQTVHTPSHLHP